MKFLIKVGKDKTLLKLIGRENLQTIIPSDRRFSQLLLLEIDKILAKAKLKEFPYFECFCDQEASLISCNIAKTTALAFNFDEKRHEPLIVNRES